MLLDVLQSKSLLPNGILTAIEAATGDFLVHEFGAGLIPTWTPVLVYERSSCRIFTTKCRTLSKLRKGFELCAISRLPARVVEVTTGPILAVIAVVLTSIVLFGFMRMWLLFYSGTFAAIARLVVHW